MSLTIGTVEGIAAKLKSMPEVKNKDRSVSKQEAVKLLSKEIAAMQKRGYTLEQIAEALKGEGLDIATPTLKNYLHRLKPTKERASKEQMDKRAGAVAVSKKKPEPKSEKATFDARKDSEEI